MSKLFYYNNEYLILLILSIIIILLIIKYYYNIINNKYEYRISYIQTEYFKNEKDLRLKFMIKVYYLQYDIITKLSIFSNFNIKIQYFHINIWLLKIHNHFYFIFNEFSNKMIFSHLVKKQIENSLSLLCHYLQHYFLFD